MVDSFHPTGLIQRYREELQVRHVARRMIQTYEQWLRRFLRYHVLLQRQDGSEALVAGLLYGSGLRQMDALRLCVHDLDLTGNQRLDIIIVFCWETRRPGL